MTIALIVALAGLIVYIDHSHSKALVAIMNSQKVIANGLDTVIAKLDTLLERE